MRLFVRPFVRPFVVLVLLLAGWGGGPAAQPAATDVAGQISALVARQTDLLNRRDVDALAELFAEDATYVGPSGAAYRGRAQIRDYYAQVFALLARAGALTGAVTRQTRVDQVAGAGGMVWAVGRGANFTSGGRGAPVATTDHWVAVYVRAGDGWRIQVLSVGDNTPRDPSPN